MQAHTFSCPGEAVLVHRGIARPTLWAEIFQSGLGSAFHSFNLIAYRVYTALSAGL